MSDTTTTDGTNSVPLGDTANIPVNGPASADGAAAVKAAAKPVKVADRPLDMTVPGGKYVLASGQTVNSEGEEI